MIVGEAFVKVSPDDRGFAQQFAKDTTPGMRAEGKRLGEELGAAIAGGLVLNKVRQVITGSIGAASDLNETVAKTQQVFGDSSRAVLAFGEDSAQAIGQSRNQAISAAATYGNLFRAVGLSEQQSAKFSVSLTKLASDLASFGNTSVDEAVQALQSGLVGETEPLRRFGINLNDAELRAESLRLGLGKIGPTLTSAQKAQAAYSLIMKQSVLAQGDFERTADGAANKQRILAAEVENAKAQLGEGLLPAYNSLLGVGVDLVETFTALPGPIRNAVLAAGGLGVVFGVAAPTLSRVRDVLSDFGGGSSLGGGARGLREFADSFQGLRRYGLGVGDSLKGASRQVGGITQAIGPANIAVAGLTATVGVGLAVYSAWATNVARVREETEALTEALIAQEGNVQDELVRQAEEILSTRDSFADSARAGRVSAGELARLVGLDRTAFNQFRDYLDNEIGSLAGGFEGTGFGTGIFGEGLFSDFDQFREGIPDSIEPTIERLVEMANAGELTEHQFREIIDAGADLSKAASGTAQSIIDTANALDKSVDVGKQSAQIQQDFATATATSGVSLEEQRAALFRLAEAFPNLARAEGLVVKGDLEDQMGANTSATEDATEALEGYADALTAAFDPVFAAINAQNKLADAQNAVGRAEQKLAEARAGVGKKSAEAQLAVDEAALDVAQRRADLESQTAKRGAESDAARAAADALADAEAKLAEQQARLGEAQYQDSTSTDVADAERDLADAKFDVVDAALDQETALARLQAAVNEGDVSVDLFGQTLMRWVEKGAITAEQARLISVQFDSVREQAAMLNGTEVTVEIKVLDADAAARIKAINDAYLELAAAAGVDGSLGQSIVPFTPEWRRRQEASRLVSGGNLTGGTFAPGDVTTIRENGLPEIALFGNQGEVLSAKHALTDALMAGAAGGTGEGGEYFAAGAIQIVAPSPHMVPIEWARQKRARAWRHGRKS